MHRRNLLLAAAGAAGAAAVPATETLTGLVDGVLAATAPADRDAWEARLTDRFSLYLSDVGRCADAVTADVATIGYTRPGAAMASVSARVLALLAKTQDSARAAASWTVAVEAADQSGETEVRTWCAGRGALDLSYDVPTATLALSLADRALGVDAGRERLGAVMALIGRAHASVTLGGRGAERTWREALDAWERLGATDTATVLGPWSDWQMALTGAHLAAREGNATMYDDMAQWWRECAPENQSRFGAHMGMYQAMLLAELGEPAAAAAAVETAWSSVPDSNRSGSLVAMRAELTAAA